jgi:hypothetical protein
VLRTRLLILLVALVVGVVFIAGLAVHGRGGGLLLAVVAVLLVALSLPTWPHLHPRGRGVRAVVIVGVTALAVAKLAGAV